MPLLRPTALFLALLQLACATCSVPSFARDTIAYEPVAEYHARSVFAQIGSPVGRLVVATEIGNYNCTAFLISKHHALTNEHCLATKTRPDTNGNTTTKTEIPIQSARLQMGFLDEMRTNESVSYPVRLPALEMDKSLDYAIIEIVGNAADRFGHLSISTEDPIPDNPLWIIGHPKGLPQQISRLTCKSVAADPRYGKRLLHSCPTVGGSSGSPVFDAGSGMVIAINHASTRKEDPSFGLAIPMREIAKHSALLRSIINAN